MNYNQEDLLQDYAQRTLENLRAIERFKQENPDAQVYEVTQLINSLLGLIVLPVEQFYRQLPAISKDELIELGWKMPSVVGDFPQVKNLCELMTHLRHAVAHFNIRFLVGESGEIQGLDVWNKNPKSGEVLWRAEMSVQELCDLIERFVGLILDLQYSKYERCYKARRGVRE